MKRAFVICLSLMFSKNISSAEVTAAAYWDGIKSSVTYLYEGSYKQFTAKNNLYWALAATPSLWYSFEEDKRITDNARTKNIPKYMQFSSDLAPALSFPIIPAVLFHAGIKYDNPTHVQFAKESMAALYLALLESSLISQIRIHERPDQKKLSSWETNFRGKSSFPSGHVVPYAVFALKTWQFYGPAYASIPSAIFVVASIQRVRDGKHYLSDVVGGLFLSAFAAEGVRKAANFNGGTEVTYRSFFEQNMSIGYIEHMGVIGPSITFNW